MRRESASRPSDGAGDPVLVWTRPHGATIEFPVNKRQAFTIGRDANSNIMMPSTFVSRTHARFQYKNGRYLIEDLGSANGTKVNGAPVAESEVAPGDTIELGDERLVFQDRAAQPKAAPATGPGKAVRLAVVAIGSLVVMGGILMMLRPSSPPAVSSSPAPPPKGPEPGVPPAPPVAPAARADSNRVREVLQEAQLAGVSATDALYDRGSVALRAGRLREAADLFAAVLDRDKTHPLAQNALRETQAQIERGAAERLARADWLVAQLRFEEAIMQWEQALQLLDPSDSRAVTAKAGIDRATRARAAR